MVYSKNNVLAFTRLSIDASISNEKYEYNPVRKDVFIVIDNACFVSKCLTVNGQ